MNRKGVILIFTFVIMVAMTVVVWGMFYMLSNQTKSAGFDTSDAQALWAAEAGIQYGAWSVHRNETVTYQTTTPTADGYCDTVYLEGYTSSADSSATNNTNASFYGTNFTTAAASYATLPKNSLNSGVTMWNFQQRFNLIGTRLKWLEIILRASPQTNTGGPTYPIVRLAYSTNSGTSWTTLGADITVNNTGWGSPIARDIPLPTNWYNFMNNNFRIRVSRVNSGGGKNTDCYIDWLALRATVEVDALTEPWNTNSYITLPYSLGNGNIQTITVSDESGKLHLNYTDQMTLQYLAEECGLSVANATTFASQVVAWRGTNTFNSVEELKQLALIKTDLIQPNPTFYTAISPYVTVYSWVNTQAQRAAVSRAPVNVNTADARVLRAIFRRVLSSANATTLADNIVTRRATIPFTHFASTYAYQSLDTHSLLYYIAATGLGGGLSANVLAVAENADASTNNYTLAGSWNGANNTATEFCYYSNAFLITSVGQSGVIQRTIKGTYGSAYDYTNYYPSSTNTFSLSTYYNEVSPHAYWSES
ncbi:MAG: type II secretion system protein GspK [Candidatus Omnitrophica bacterium]|nr:type II secretion system protein GspK [Candidatus Omnitrophota bacterium]